MSVPRICDTCTFHLLTLFRFGLCSRVPIPRVQRPCFRSQKFAVSHVRAFTVRSPSRFPDVQSENNDHDFQQMSHTVTKTRRTFGDTLPEAFLSAEEYKLYERLYGPPLGVTKPQDVAVLQDIISGKSPTTDDDLGGNDILREDEDGNLEKVGYVPKTDSDSQELGEHGLGTEEPVNTSQDHDDIQPAENGLSSEESADSLPVRDETQEENETTLDTDFDERFETYVEDMISSRAMSEHALAEEGQLAEDESKSVAEESEEDPEEWEKVEEENDFEDFEDRENAYTSSHNVRRHPLTAAGKWGPSPSTIQLPKDTFVDPISAILSQASNKHLAETAQKVFGGKELPNSTATPSPKMVEGGVLKQSSIALEASQSYMGEMEANAYLAAIMPGAYATTLSCLTEVRKRLGPQWLQNLLKREGGPRVLDAGAGGAGVLAWRELLRSEWDMMHPEANTQTQRVPFGKSTVVTGSPSLRHRSSTLLDNTTFLPRLPDYNPSKDHPSLDTEKGSPRKQYDVILAPYTLWTLREDHMRKAQVQNFWSLLNPNGGVLVVIEKGVPRGFELVAGAREVLLKNHIASPGNSTHENRIDEPVEGRFREKETGMIVAPCTSHGKCPMYLFSGKTVGRRDYCHFSQRYIRPSFLQRIIGQSHRNHEDIRFSFVAVQRGMDQRQIQGFQQGQIAEDHAFDGYGEDEPLRTDEEADVDTKQSAEDESAGSVPVNPLSFPRIILPPIKRRGHIILDACTPAGKIERWTVPKSYGKRAYADARKAQWGDLWALGAKTRITRDVRIGREAVKPRGRRRFEAEASNPEDVREIGQSAKMHKRHKKELKKSQKRVSDEIDV
ncbi:MAG: hypothetical protein Q9186_005384 [Xanthomendoza sp. 1 TL-2023]